MTFTDARCFVDTNILVYAHDPSSPVKGAVARELVQELWRNGNGSLSTQILQEFYVTVTRKVPRPLASAKALEIVRALGNWNLQTTELSTIISAGRLSELHKLSFWDSLVLTAAQQAQAQYLVTEDLQHGFKLGELEIINPFAV